MFVGPEKKGFKKIQLKNAKGFKGAVGTPQRGTAGPTHPPPAFPRERKKRRRNLFQSSLAGAWGVKIKHAPGSIKKSKKRRRIIFGNVE